MPLLDDINARLIDAAKTNQPLVRDTLRMVKTSIKNTEISKGHALSDEEIIDVLAKEVKQRQESADSFHAASRLELAEKEEAEIEILKQYLPEQLSEEAIAKLVDEAVVTTSASSAADMGKVMGALMPKVKGKADGNLVSKLVREKLAA
jgi:uncharacterized protein YqeY